MENDTKKSGRQVMVIVKVQASQSGIWQCEMTSDGRKLNRIVKQSANDVIWVIILTL